MSAPAAIWLFLEVMTLVIYIVNHGKSRGNYDAIAQTVNAALSLWLLWWGGFFS